MFNPFKRKPNAYDAERDRLLLTLASMSPEDETYHVVMTRLSEIDKIRNRTSELKKTIIPAAGASFAIGGIYALQQFGGVIVPRSLEAYAARQENKKHPKELED